MASQCQAQKRLAEDERANATQAISGDNHIDLTYCPATSGRRRRLPSGAERARSRSAMTAALVRRRQGPRHVERRRPGFLPYTKGSFWPYRREKDAASPGQLSRRQAQADTPELRIGDLDRDGLEKEIHLRLLMVTTS